MTATLAQERPWKRPPLIRNAWLRWALYLGALVYLVAALSALEVNWVRVSEGLSQGWRFIQGFLVPDFVNRSRDIWRGFVRPVLAGDEQEHDVGVRGGRTPAGRRPARPRLAAALVLSRPAVEAALGHHQHRDARHASRHRPGNAGGISRRPQHDAARRVHPPPRAARDRRLAVDQLADLGAAAGGHHRAPGCSPASSPSRCGPSASSASCSTRRSRRSMRRK
jgi:hypothetical protein